MSRNWMKGMLVWGVAVSSVGCVGMGILGVPLGPQTSDGLDVSGVVFPTITLVAGGGAVCSFPNPASAFFPYGEMEVGAANSAFNEYTAILQSQNTRLPNTCNKTNTLQPNYQGSYGCNDSNGITVIGANIRYEYPTLSALVRFTPTNQQTPADGFLLQNRAMATGYVPTGQDGQITLKIIDKELARHLAEDEDFQKALNSDLSVPIVARIRLEGRTDGGARATSNEFTYRIEAKGSCAIQPNKPTCPAGTTFRRGGSCFPGQDEPDCACR